MKERADSGTMRYFVPFAMLLCTVVHAQLELPEYLFPEDGPEEGAVEVAPPRHEGNHKNENAKDPEEAAEEEVNPELVDEQRMRMMLNRSQEIVLDRRPSGSPQPLKGDKDILKRLLSGSEFLQVSIQTGSDTLNGELLNESVWVSNELGRLILRLSQVTEVQVNEGTWTFVMKGGDQLVGKLDKKTLDLQLADGSRRVLPLDQIQGIKLR